MPLKNTMMEKITNKEYQNSLGNGVPTKIQAIDANGDPILSTPSELMAALKNAGMFRRIFFPLGTGSQWLKIMEIKRGINCSFLLNMICYANQPASIIVGYVTNYDDNVMHCDFKQLIGRAGETYNPNIKYRKKDGTISIWAKDSIVSNKASCITILHGNAEFPMIIETPPEEAIQPIW
mgnify:FL=1